MKFEGTLSLW